MKVLVTGGSGWIGSATSRALVEAGHESIVFDRANGQDITHREAVEACVAGVDHVIHLAGLLGTHELFEQPHAAVEVNVLGALNITHACAETGVGLTEITMPRVNPSLYAATKACAMDMAEAYRKAGKLRASYVRAYNAFGPGQAYGGRHPQKIIPTFATKAWANEPIPVWGDGSLLVDLVHVDDVARMLVDAIPFGDGETFDAGSGEAQTVVEVAKSVIDITGSTGGIDFLPQRQGERKRSTEADVARGESWNLLEWHPRFDTERLVETVESYRTKKETL
jgi:UDP-glucose 4-epimerase